MAKLLFIVFVFRQQFVNYGLKHRYITFNGVPKTHRVNIVIAVDKDVAHSLNLPPVDIGVGFTKFICEHINSLTYYFYQFDKPIKNNRIILNVIIGILLFIGEQLTYCCLNMLKPAFVLNSFSHKSKVCPFELILRRMEAICLLRQDLRYDAGCLQAPSSYRKLS